MESTRNIFQDVFEDFQKSMSIDLCDVDLNGVDLDVDLDCVDLGVDLDCVDIGVDLDGVDLGGYLDGVDLGGYLDGGDIGDYVDLHEVFNLQSAIGVPITNDVPFGKCVIGFPVVVDGLPATQYLIQGDEGNTNTLQFDPSVFEFVPEPMVKSKKTDVAALKEIEAFLKECIQNKDDAEMVQQDYIPFGDGGTSSRDLDRNKDIALTLKMVSAVYKVPLHQVYKDLGNITHFTCVKCGEHRPQRGALLCYYCGKTNTATFADLISQYLALHNVV